MDLHKLTDAELVKLFKKGNEWCFEEIYQRYYKVLCGYTTKRMPSKEDAEEVTHAALLLAFKHLHAFREEASLTTWLYCILKNQICNYYRAIQRKNVLITQYLELVNLVREITDYNLPENKIIKREAVRHIITAINKLPEVLRKTAKLYFIDGLTIKVIVKILDCPEGTIRSRVHRIKEYLRDFLDGEE